MLSFRQALALAEACDAGELEEYQAAHSRLAHRPQVMARLLADHCTLPRRRVLHGLASDPDLIARMLTAHVKEASPAFFAEATARLASRIIDRKTA